MYEYARSKAIYRTERLQAKPTVLRSQIPTRSNIEHSVRICCSVQAGLCPWLCHAIFPAFKSPVRTAPGPHASNEGIIANSPGLLGGALRPCTFQAGGHTDTFVWHGSCWGRNAALGDRLLIQGLKFHAWNKTIMIMKYSWDVNAKLVRETSPGTRARNQKEPENHDGTQSSSWERKEKECRETRPGTLGNHDGTQCRNTRETSLTTLPGTRWNQDMLMEQNARRLGRQSPEPNRNQNTGETMMEQNARIPGTKESWWNKNTAELLEPKP